MPEKSGKKAEPERKKNGTVEAKLMRPDPGVLKTAQRLLNEGATRVDIADEVSVTTRTIYNWIEKGYLHHPQDISQQPESAEISEPPATPSALSQESPLPPLVALLQEKCQRGDHAWLQGDGPQRDYSVEETHTESRGRTELSGRRRICAFCGHAAAVGEPIIFTVA